MIADRAWALRNLGFDPSLTTPPDSAFAFPGTRRTANDLNLQRELIDFDSEAFHGREFLAFSRATGLSRFTELDWPRGLAPKTGAAPRRSADAPLPRADVLLVTWTVDEGHALSRVLTPGKDSRDDYQPYTHNFESVSKRMRAGCPARTLERLGTYWTTQIRKKSVVVFKSDSHMSQDGPELPNIDVWRQLIAEVKPSLVITTGTAGGIGAEFEVGDVVVSPIVRFDCTAKFKRKPFALDSFTSAAPKTTHFAQARQLFKANADQLPKDNTRAPKIVRGRSLGSSVVTTDFFGFDTSNDHYKLKGLGDACEMGDAVLGLVAKEMGESAPRCVAVRNISDPQIKADGTLKEQAALAANIYKAYGRWSTVCSAIVCWALIAAE